MSRETIAITNRQRSILPPSYSSTQLINLIITIELSVHHLDHQVTGEDPEGAHVLPA